MSSSSHIFSVLVKPVSSDCNLACEYCFYSSKADELYPETRIHRMSLRVLRELIAQLMVLSPDQASFCWQGGEPTLAGLDFYKEAVRYQSLFSIPGQLVMNSLQTNGTLIDEHWAEFLARFNFLVGVSLDGPPEFHDYYRKDRLGNPSYERVMRGIEWLRKFNVKFNILVLLNQHNIKYPRELYHFFIDQGFRFLQFIPCVERDSETGEIASYSITPEQYGHFLCEVFDEWVAPGIPKVYVRDFDELLISYVTGEAPSCIFSRECGKYVVVEFNGDVYACDFFVEPRWFLGNLMEQPLEKIIESERFMEFKRIKSKLINDNCRGCRWLQYCNGGCPKHWIQLGLNHNYFCSAYKAFFEHSHEKFLELKELIRKRMRGEGGILSSYLDL